MILTMLNQINSVPSRYKELLNIWAWKRFWKPLAQIGVMGLMRDDNDHSSIWLEALIFLANKRLILELLPKKLYKAYMAFQAKSVK